jgi:translation initiation factor 5B
MYGWVANTNSPFRKSLEKQKDEPKLEFRDRSRETILAFSTQGYNACMYWDMKDWASDYIALVPTSAITGEGLPDLLSVLVGITQKLMSKALTYSPELEATVLEVKMVEGLGYTIDVILVNGELKEGDQIVLCGWDGPIVTKIRALLTPPPNTEFRVKV